MLNKCILVGKICSEITEREAGKDKVMNFRLNTWSTRNGKRWDGWHTIQIWNKNVRDDVRSFPEGTMVMCEGSYQTRMVEKDGVKTYYSNLQAFKVDRFDADGISGDAPKSTPPSGGGHGPIKSEDEDFGF